MKMHLLKQMKKIENESEPSLQQNCAHVFAQTALFAKHPHILTLIEGQGGGRVYQASTSAISAPDFLLGAYCQ